MRDFAQEFRAGHLSEFVRLAPGSVQQALSEARADVDRVALVEALTAYHTDLGTLDESVKRGLEQLRHPQSRVVVTGQQAVVLGGPAYSVHKAVDAVLLARSLDREEAPVLPVFWVASQDHDVAEVASTTLVDMDEELHHLTLDLPSGRSVGKVAWQDAWSDQIRHLLAAFAAPAPHRAWVSGLVERAVARGGSVADVFARLMHGLLGDQGLIVLDPMHPALARLMAPALERELNDPLSSSTAIEDAARRLVTAGFVPQLRRAPGATNLFIEESDGDRRLLRWQDGLFRTASRSYAADQLVETVRHDPTRLTPAAGLRPVVQDSILPTVVFVVGPGELAYGAQLRGVYELHGLLQPLLHLRLSVTWLEPNVARLLDRLGATAAEVQADPEGVLGGALAQEQASHVLTKATLDQVQSSLEELTDRLAALDPTLRKAAERTQIRTLRRFEHLRRLASEALAHAEDRRTGQLRRLKLHLLPLGKRQEREMNFLTYLLKHGRAPLDQLLALEPGTQAEVRIA